MTATRFIAASLFATLMAAPALADGPVQQNFTRDGIRYVYTTTTQGDRTIIEGRQLSNGSAFRLIVRNNRVSGEAGGVPVSFLIDRALAAPKRELAQR